MYLNAVCLHASELRCPWISTVDYLAAVYFPMMDSVCHELSTVDYLAAICFSHDGFSLCHELSTDIPRCDLLSSDGLLSAMNYQLWINYLTAVFFPLRDCLRHELSTVDYLTMVCFPLIDFPCPMDYQLSSVPSCSVFMDYLLSDPAVYYINHVELTIKKLHLHQVRHQLCITWHYIASLKVNAETLYRSPRNIMNTVKLVYKDHPRDPQNMVLIHRWSLYMQIQ